jgi:hypothetical protein
MINNTWLIQNTIKTPFILFSLLRNLKRQEKFLRQTIYPELETAKKINDDSLDEQDFRKITHYYGLAVPAILGEAICALRGIRMSHKERMALTYQGAMTGLFDDFFDKRNLSNEEVSAYLQNPQELTGRNTSETLFLEFYTKSLTYAHDPSLMLTYLCKVYEAQIASRKQALPGLTKEEISGITLNKGGSSVLFYRSVMSHPFQQNEEEAFYKLGGLMQLGNDIFDIYKDRNNEVHTLATTANKIDDLRTIFRSMMNDSFNAINKTDYSYKNRKKFLRLLSMSFCSRCFVCLEHLEEKENLTDGVFSLHQYSRQDLVCNMEKKRNKWRSVSYHIRQRI